MPGFRLQQGPFGIASDDGWCLIGSTSVNQKYYSNPGMGFVGYAWEEAGASLAARRGDQTLQEHIDDLLDLPFVDILYIRCDWRDVQSEPGKLNLSPIWNISKKTRQAPCFPHPDQQYRRPAWCSCPSRLFAKTGILYQREIHGVALNFHGLGCQGKTEFWQEERDWAKLGWLVVFPFYGPWSWMNRSARKLVDDITDAVYRHYHLEDSIPLASLGGSMGGLSALLYSRYSKRKIDRCYAQYPVCDLRYHYREREDLPKTIYNAALGYESPDAFFLEASPLEQAENLPHIPYLILTRDADEVVLKENHSDRMAARLRNLGRDIRHIVVPGYGHGNAEVASQYYDQTLEFMKI